MSRHSAVGLIGGVLALFLVSGEAMGKGGVVGTPHDLSSGGPGTPGVTSFNEPLGRVCIFCHAPHHTSAGGPLWNRQPNTETYQTYVLASTQQPVGQPSGPSRLCLSCHDGAIGHGIASFNGSPFPAVLLQGAANLGTNLTNDHPISFPYPAVQAEMFPLAQVRANGRIKLDGDLVQCTSCHDPHDNEFTKFLVIDNRPSNSPLCITCHDLTGWHDSIHNSTNAPNLTGCMSCHGAHNTVNIPLLKNYDCTTTCHNGTGPGTANIQAVLATSVNQVSSFSTPAKSVSRLAASTAYHGCADCHNPHQATTAGDAKSAGVARTSPLILKGALKGVRGTSAESSISAIAKTEFEICYRCHSGLASSKLRAPLGTQYYRMITEPDQMKRFDRMNPSFHPVAADRRTNGASLLSQYQASMIRIACTDCHNSDQSRKAGGNGPNGPHGSQFPHLLMARYEMPPAGSPRQSYTAGLYALCYRCHNEEYIMGASSRFTSRGINQHVTHVKVKGYPCFVCHDPHGVPVASGATTLNNSHLINFDRGYTVNAALPNPYYQMLGLGAGSCTVSCHSSNPKTYGP